MVPTGVPGELVDAVHFILVVRVGVAVQSDLPPVVHTFVHDL